MDDLPRAVPWAGLFQPFGLPEMVGYKHVLITIAAP